MKIKPLTLFCLLFVSLSFSQERLVPFDDEGKIEKIDSELELKLNFFPYVKDFTQAFLFQLPDSGFALEIWYRSGEATMKTRQILTNVEADILRKKIGRSLTQFAPNAGLNQEGRPTLIGTMYSLGFGFYGWGIPYVLNVQDQAAFMGTYLLVGGGAIFAAYASTERMDIPQEAANLFTLGSFLGIGHGILLHGIILGDNTETQGYVLSGMLGGIAEGIIGFNVANKLKLSSSTVEMIGTNSAFGILGGLGTSYVADINDRRGFFSIMFAGSVLGTLSGAELASSQYYTSGDVNVYQMCTMLGGSLPMTVLRLGDDDNTKHYVSAAMIGGVVGATIGHIMLANKDFTIAEGGYISLGTIAAGTFGLSVCVLGRAEPKTTLLVTSGTALLGFGAMYSHYADAAVSRAEHTSFEFNIRSEGLLALSQGKTNSWQSRIVFPIAQMKYHF